MKQVLVIFLICISSCFPSYGNALKFINKYQQVKVPPNELKTTVQFQFTNSSSQDIIIRKIDAPCECLTATITGGKKLPNSTVSFKPGEKGRINGHLDLGNFKGAVTKKILAWTHKDKEAAPSILLTMEVKVPKLIASYPNSHVWKATSEAKPKTFLVKVIDNKPIKIITHKVSNEVFKYSVETVKEGFEYKILVKPISTTTPTFGAIQLTTDSPNTRYKRVTCFVSVKP